MTLHEDGAVLRSGEPLETAARAMMMLHGRGASAAGYPVPGAACSSRRTLPYLAPQAANNTWYPYPFTQPMERNEPWLSSALARVGQMLGAGRTGRHPAERTYLLGFSQGACLALEYAARHAAATAASSG